MMKRSLLALAACATLALPAAAADVSPSTATQTGHQCYTLSSGLAGGWTLNVDLRFMQKTIAIAGRGACTQATNPPGLIKTNIRGHYYPLSTSMIVMATGRTAPGKDAAADKTTVNAEITFKVPFDGTAGTGSYSCLKSDGTWAAYDTATVTKVECPPLKPTKK
ncbi:MAG: DUF1842 domain-containing protein [Rhodospirillaceae bacterium]